MHVDTASIRDAIERDESEVPSDDDERADDERDESEPAPAPEPPPLTPAEVERQTKDLEKEAKRHAAAVQRIMGDDFALLVPSPLDFTPGYLWSPTMVPLPDEVRAEVLALLGVGPGPELREAPDAQACDDCDAWGIVLTGSKVESQRTKPCAGCNGHGWRANVQAPTVTSPGSWTATLGATPPWSAGTDSGPDAWGRTPGHPHYGKHPNTVGV